MDLLGCPRSFGRLAKIAGTDQSVEPRLPIGVGFSISIALVGHVGLDLSDELGVHAQPLVDVGAVGLWVIDLVTSAGPDARLGRQIGRERLLNGRFVGLGKVTEPGERVVKLAFMHHIDGIAGRFEGLIHELILRVAERPGDDPHFVFRKLPAESVLL